MKIWTNLQGYIVLFLVLNICNLEAMTDHSRILKLKTNKRITNHIFIGILDLSFTFCLYDL